MGRPSLYTDNLVDEICARLASGEPMAKIVQSAHMPDSVTIYRWLREKPDFQQRYTDARKDGAHCLADQIQDIVDTEPLAVFDEAGNKRYDAGSIAHNRLRMDARKWLAAKYLPKVYGDKTILAGDADAPLAVSVDFSTWEAMLKNAELAKQGDGQPS